MQSREEIQELNDHLQAFPKAEDIFVKEQPWLKNHFLPLMSIDLAEINPDWVGSGGYIICFMSLLAVSCYSLLIIRKRGMWFVLCNLHFLFFVSFVGEENTK